MKIQPVHIFLIISCSATGRLICNVFSSCVQAAETLSVTGHKDVLIIGKPLVQPATPNCKSYGSIAAKNISVPSSKQ